MRVRFAGYRPDNGARVELAAIDPHRAAETAADFEGGFDHGVAAEARRNRLEIGDLAYEARYAPHAFFRRDVPKQGLVHLRRGTT